MPSFNITVLQVEPKEGVSKAGKPYTFTEVAFKNNSFQGKLESFKLISFDKALVAAVQGMKSGSTYDVEREKQGEFWKWLKVTPASADASSPAAAEKATTGAPKAAFSSNSYPTNEERAKTQVQIVRQSMLKAALDKLAIGAKVAPSDEQVFNQAQKFIDWIYEEKKPTMESLINTPNDIDEVE